MGMAIDSAVALRSLVSCRVPTGAAGVSGELLPPLVILHWHLLQQTKVRQLVVFVSSSGPHYRFYIDL